MFCGLLQEGKTVFVAARCPFCLSDDSTNLQWDQRIVEFTTPQAVRNHLKHHIRAKFCSQDVQLPCPHPLCDKSEPYTVTRLLCHFSDAHGLKLDHLKDLCWNVQGSDPSMAVLAASANRVTSELCGLFTEPHKDVDHRRFLSRDTPQCNDSPSGGMPAIESARERVDYHNSWLPIDPSLLASSLEDSPVQNDLQCLVPADGSAERKVNQTSSPEREARAAEEPCSSSTIDERLAVLLVTSQSTPSATSITERHEAQSFSVDLESPTDYSSLNYALPFDATVEIQPLTRPQDQSPSTPKTKTSSNARYQTSTTSAQPCAREDAMQPMTRAKRRMLDEQGMRRLRNRRV